MEMSEFVNNSDTRSAISKIITWVEEPKSADTRSAAKSVIASMFNLNPPEFSALITGLDRQHQVTVCPAVIMIASRGIQLDFFSTFPSYTYSYLELT